MIFIDVTDQSLRAARPGIELVEEVLEDAEFPIYLYGLTSKETVLLAAAASLAQDDTGTGPKPSEVAIAFQCRKEALSLLYGSGLTLADQDFAYLIGSDGVRTTTFHLQSGHAKVITSDFNRLALADSDAWLDDFLAKYGMATQTIETVGRGRTPAVKASRKHINSIDDFLAH